MMRRFMSAAALAACVGSYAFAAERATFILTDGSRKSGELVSHGGEGANFIDGDLNLGNNGKEEPIHIGQVAVIDIAGGTPAASELSRVPADGQAVATRDGNVAPGKFVNIVHGDTLLWENAGGQQTQYALRDVARIYLNPTSARTAFNYNGPAGSAAAGAVGTTGAQGRAIRVDANRGWIDTGLTVNAGDRVSFQASGEIQFGRSPGQTATPDGNASMRSANYPDPSVPVGSLIGRIGNGKPFAIGTQTQPLGMPASGRLYLGVNDNETADNSGFFSVIVAKQ
jgi:PA-IL-like protein